MSQILLNDPNRAGGPSNLDLSLDVGVVGPLNAARLALWAADINQKFAEYDARLGYDIGSLIPFSTTIPLGATAATYMPAQSVCGPLAFSPGASPVVGAQCSVRLTADGVHVPTFPGFTVSSSGYNNTLGVVNVAIFRMSSSPVVIVAQDGGVNAPSILRPGISSLSLIHGANPTLTIAVGGVAPLNTAAVPAASAFTVNATQGATVGGVSVSANAITLTLAGNVALGDTVTVTYSPPVLNSPLAHLSVPIRDTNGNQLAAFTSASVTVS